MRTSPIAIFIVLSPIFLREISANPPVVIEEPPLAEEVTVTEDLTSSEKRAVKAQVDSGTSEELGEIDEEESKGWPLFRGDAGMTGVSSVPLSPPFELAWTFETGAREGVPGTAVIDAEGRAFIGCSEGVFYALSLATGQKLWSWTEKLATFEGAACLVGDLVVTGCGDGFVYAFDCESGELVWKFETGGEILGSPNLLMGEAGEARVLIGSYDNFCYCLDGKTGEKIWAKETGNYINGAPAISDGHCFFGGCDGFLYQIDVNSGEEIAAFEMEAQVANTVAVADGIAYAAHYGNRVVAIEIATGEKVWEYGEREFPYFASPAVSAMHVFAGSRDKRLYAIDRVTGEASWEFRAGDEVDSSPVVCGEGEDAVVYFGSGDGKLYALSAADGKELWSYEIGAEIRSSPAVAAGWLVIGCDDGNVYGFRAVGD